MVPRPLVLLALLCHSGAVLSATPREAPPPPELPDVNLTTVEMISRRGYPAESHLVTTEDGYILTVHRIARPGRPVVFLQHGMQGSSADWVIMEPNESLGYLLSDAGYDVWLGNARGNRYSRDHVTLNTSDINYWQFSWHEMGVYDLPAVIDHILNTTGEARLNYVGYSMGTTMFWVMTSQRPDYNQKIRQMQALAPVAYVGTWFNTLPKMRWFFNSYYFTKQRVWGEYIPEESLIRLASDFSGCRDVTNVGACKNIYFINVIRESSQFNLTNLPVILSHLPSGASMNTLHHYYQLLASGKFLQYDFGYTNNTLKYNTSSPPEYNLSKVTAPVYLHYAERDKLAEPFNVEKLCSLISDCRASRRVPLHEFTHADFNLGLQAKTLVYDDVMANLELP